MTLDEKIKKLSKFFRTRDLSFIELSGEDYSISLSTWKYVEGETIEQVVNNFFDEFGEVIREWEKEQEDEDDL